MVIYFLTKFSQKGQGSLSREQNICIIVLPLSIFLVWVCCYHHQCNCEKLAGNVFTFFVVLKKSFRGAVLVYYNMLKTWARFSVVSSWPFPVLKCVWLFKKFPIFHAVFVRISRNFFLAIQYVNQINGLPTWFFFQHQFELSFQKVKNAKWCGLFNTQVLLLKSGKYQW